MACAIFVLILLSVFHGYVSGYPAKGMLKTINIFFFVVIILFFSLSSFVESLASLL